MNSGLRNIVVESPLDPRCRLLCKGDRGANEGPARPAHLRDGTKVLWCPCCNRALTEIKLDIVGHPPNLIADARAEPTRWEDAVVSQFD